MSVPRISLLVQLATPAINVGARPTLVNQFADISGWRSSGFGPRFAYLDFDGDQALTIDSPAGGAQGPELWGIVNGKIRLLAYTRARPIVIAAATRGYGEETQDVGLATGLYLAGAPSIGTPTVSFIPVEAWGAA